MTIVISFTTTEKIANKLKEEANRSKLITQILERHYHSNLTREELTQELLSEIKRVEKDLAEKQAEHAELIKVKEKYVDKV